MVAYVGSSRTLGNQWRHYDQIFWVEQFNLGMRQVLDAVETSHAVDLTTMSELNRPEINCPKRAHTVADYFGDLSMHLMFEMYNRDLYLFKYDFFDPANQMAMADLDLAVIHVNLACSAFAGADGSDEKLQTR